MGGNTRKVEASGGKQNLPDELKCWEEKDRLGDGMSGEVHRVIHNVTGEKAALKVIAKNRLHDQSDIDAMYREIRLLQNLKHKHILKYITHKETKKNMYLLTELIEGGELFDMIVSKSKYTENDAKEVVLIMLDILRYLHNKNIVHRDIKPENIMLVDKSDWTTVKIIDFGLAMEVKDDYGGIYQGAGTPGYLAPETLIQNPNYGKPADIWALGVITYILLVGYPPFYADDDDDSALFRSIRKGTWAFDPEDVEDVSQEAQDFVAYCLTMDPRKRPKVRDCYKHAWLKNEASPKTVRAQKSLVHAQLKLRQHQARKRLKKGILKVLYIQRLQRSAKLARKIKDKAKEINKLKQLDSKEENDSKSSVGTKSDDASDTLAKTSLDNHNLEDPKK